RAVDAWKEFAPGDNRLQILKNLEIELYLGFNPESKLRLVPHGIVCPSNNKTLLGRERSEDKNALHQLQSLLLRFFSTGSGWSSIPEGRIFQNDRADQVGIVGRDSCCCYGFHRMPEEIQ